MSACLCVLLSVVIKKTARLNAGRMVGHSLPGMLKILTAVGELPLLQ